jgi:hypothetical protein
MQVEQFSNSYIHKTFYDKDLRRIETGDPRKGAIIMTFRRLESAARAAQILRNYLPGMGIVRSIVAAADPDLNSRRSWGGWYPAGKTYRKKLIGHADGDITGRAGKGSCTRASPRT